MSVGQATYWRNTETETDPESGDVETGDVEAVDGTGNELTREEAEAQWAEAAQEILSGVAGTYRALIEYAQLATLLQEKTGIHTRAQVRSWVGRVLTLVAQGNHERNEPPLIALVVHKSDGMVGAGYDTVLKLAGEPTFEDPDDREKHAAGARLECYRWAGATLPDDGGKAALSPRLDSLQSLRRRQRKALEEPTICTTCFMAIPPTGVCDNCG